MVNVVSLIYERKHTNVKIQAKAVRGWNLTNLSYVCHHIFLSIAQIGPCFQGPIHG